MAGYVRPRLTDKQAELLQLLLDRQLAGPRPLLEVRMLGRAQRAIDAAFEAREERRATRAADAPDPTCHIEAWSEPENPALFGWHCLTHDEDSGHTEYTSVDEAIAAGTWICARQREVPS